MSTPDCIRRDFLKAGGLTGLAVGLNTFSPGIFHRRVLAAPNLSKKKLIFLFQRGGNDGVNTVIPRGDPEYNSIHRPTLFIDPAEALDLGNGFAQLHPQMQSMLDIYNHTSLTGIAGPGNLAAIHRIGYAGQSQSHFDSQQYWENGLPGQPDREEGMIYRQVAKTLDPTNNHFVAASLSSSQMVALKGSLPLPTLSDPANFKFSGNPSRVSKFLGSLPSAPSGPGGKGFLGLYGGPRDFPQKPYRDTVYSTGVVLAEAVQVVQSAVGGGTYTPANGAVYPTGDFGDKLRSVAMLLKRTPVQVLGVNIGGWDTHTDQGSTNGPHGDLLRAVADGFKALYLDLQEQWQDLVIVTLTEFGRTSIENDSLGTDHAYACVSFVAGGGVRGGVYNCGPGTWAPGDLFSQDSRYVRHRTDYRAVFAEIFMKHFGDDRALLNEVIPGYDAAAAASPGDFQFLNFMA